MVTCSNCKEIYHENATHCPNCGTEALKPKYVPVEKTGDTSERTYVSIVSETGKSEIGSSSIYATFGERVLAYLIDAIIIIIFTGVLSGIFGGFGTILSFITTACYYGYFESSKYMGTPGKILMKLKVISANGQPISFLNGVGRYAAKFISSLILGIGFLFPLFTARKQTLHDMIANCIVVKR